MKIQQLLAVISIVFISATALAETQQPTEQQQQSFAACMAQHGQRVPQPPTGGMTPPQPPQAFLDCMTQQGQTLPQPPQGDPQDGQPPQLTSAQQAALAQCKQYLPQGGPQGGPQGNSSQAKAFDICRQQSLSGQ